MPPALGDHAARLKALQLSVAVMEQWDADKADSEAGYLDGLIDKVARAGKISRKSSVAKSICAMASRLVSQCMASLHDIDDYILKCVKQWGNSSITKETVEKLSPFNLALIRLGAHRALHHAKPENVGREMQELSRQAFREHAKEVTPIFGIFNHLRKPLAKQQAKGGPKHYAVKAMQPAPRPETLTYPPGFPGMNPNAPVVAPTNIPLFMNTMGLNPMMAHSMLMSGASLPHGLNPMMMNPMMMQPMMPGPGRTGTVRGPVRGGMQYGARGEVGMTPVTAPEKSTKSSSSSSSGGSASGDSGDSEDSSSESSDSDSSERVRRRRKNPTAFPGDNPSDNPVPTPGAAPVATAADNSAAKDTDNTEKGAHAAQTKGVEVLEGVESPPLPGMLPGTGRKPSDDEEDENDPTLKMPSAKVKKNILINNQTMAETAEKAMKGALDRLEKGTQTEKDPIDGTCTVWRFRKPKKKRRKVMN